MYQTKTVEFIFLSVYYKVRAVCARLVARAVEGLMSNKQQLDCSNTNTLFPFIFSFKCSMHNSDCSHRALLPCCHHKNFSFRDEIVEGQ